MFSKVEVLFKDVSHLMSIFLQLWCLYRMRMCTDLHEHDLERGKKVLRRNLVAQLDGKSPYTVSILTPPEQVFLSCEKCNKSNIFFWTPLYLKHLLVCLLCHSERQPILIFKINRSADETWRSFCKPRLCRSLIFFWVV